MSSTLHRRITRALLNFSFLLLVSLSTQSPARAQLLDAANTHACAVDTGGGVQCWGWGYLGIEGIYESFLPVRAKGLDSGVVAVAVGTTEAFEAHSCALRASGQVLCWGFNSSGELGDGTTTNHPVPTPVVGLGAGSGVVAIAVGYEHACALRGNGEMLCWGSNSYGKLGTGRTGDEHAPATVSGFGPGASVIGIAAGRNHTCAVKSDQSVYCWGDNTAGALGDGTSAGHMVPMPVATLGAGSGVVRVSAGFDVSCAVLTGGAARCWGYNQDGQLGNGTRTTARVPSTVLLPGVVEISSFRNHTCAHTGAGQAFCWGINGSGELGDGTQISHYIPMPVSTLDTGVQRVAAGNSYSCARKSDGALFCWGSNFTGQLGIGSNVMIAVVPQPVAPLETIFSDGFDF